MNGLTLPPTHCSKLPPCRGRVDLDADCLRKTIVVKVSSYAFALTTEELSDNRNVGGPRERGASDSSAPQRRNGVGIHLDRV